MPKATPEERADFRKNQMRLVARCWAERGYPVHPLRHIVKGACSCRNPECESPGKHPDGTKNGLKEAVTDLRQVDALWARRPQANVGINTDRFLVLDYDWDPDAGDPYVPPPTDTLVVWTGVRSDSRRGWQAHYQQPDPPIGNAGKEHFVAHYDLRGVGGYVLAPGSEHVSKVFYDVAVDLPQGPCPEWIIRAHKSKKHRSRGAGRNRTEGGRNNAENAHGYVGGIAVGQGIADPDEVAREVVNRALESGLPPDEVRKTAVSSISAGIEEGRKHERATDLGNARRLVNQHGREIKYSRGDGWRVWDGNRWTEDDTGEVERRAKDTVRSILIEAYQDESKDNAKLIQWAAASQSTGRIRAMIELAKTEPEIARRVADFDQYPFLLSVGNGTLDLRTGKLRPADPADLITRGTSVSFEGLDAPAPQWEAFVKWCTRGDVDLARYLQQAGGYTLTGSIQEEKIFFLHGEPGGGKGTFINALTACLGELAQAAPSSMLEKKPPQASGHSEELAVLAGARFVPMGETTQGREWDTQRANELSGGDLIRASRKGMLSFQFTPQFKMWISGNHRPRLKNPDDGIWRRIKRVPFKARLNGPKDEQLKARLVREEGPGILAWFVRGCLEWQAAGRLVEPAAVSSATAEYQQEEDRLSEFLTDLLVFRRDAKIGYPRLYARYQQWAGESGIRPGDMLDKTELINAVKEHADKTEQPVVTRNGAAYVKVYEKPDGHSKSRQDRGMHGVGLASDFPSIDQTRVV